MLEQHLQQLTSELELPPVGPKDEQSQFRLELANDLFILCKELDLGFYLKAEISPCPPKKREELFIELMKANFLGMGTGENVIGLDHDEKNLTLSRAITYDVNYKIFKETIEEFANYLDYWRSEIERHRKAAEEGIL